MAPRTCAPRNHCQMSLSIELLMARAAPRANVLTFDVAMSRRARMAKEAATQPGVQW